MNRVAPEVAQEIGVFFENDNIDTGSCEQKSQHHTRWSAAGNTTARREHFHDLSRDFPFWGFIYVRSYNGHRLMYAPASAVFRGTSGRRALYLDELKGSAIA